jgi:hypothetical protein
MSRDMVHTLEMGVADVDGAAGDHGGGGRGAVEE